MREQMNNFDGVFLYHSNCEGECVLVRVLMNYENPSSPLAQEME